MNKHSLTLNYSTGFFLPQYAVPALRLADLLIVTCLRNILTPVFLVEAGELCHRCSPSVPVEKE